MAAGSVLGVPEVQPSFLDDLSGAEATQTGAEGFGHRRAGRQTTRRSRDIGRIAPYPFCREPGPAAGRGRIETVDQAASEPIISLDFHQQTSLDWRLSSWVAGHRRRAPGPPWFVDADLRRVRQLRVLPQAVAPAAQPVPVRGCGRF